MSSDNRSRASSTTSVKSDASYTGKDPHVAKQADYGNVVANYATKQALIKGLAERRKALGKKGGKTRRHHKKTQKRKHHRKTSHRRK